MFMPTIKKVTKTGVETMDLSSYSFQEYRDIYIAEPITDELSVRVITQLKYLDQSEGDIHLYINSPGGIRYSRNGNLRCDQVLQE